MSHVYVPNGSHFFFRVDPNRTNRLFQINKFIMDREVVFFLSCKLFPKFKNWIFFPVAEWCAERPDIINAHCNSNNGHHIKM